MKPTLGQLRKLIGNPRVYALQRGDGGWTPIRSPLTTAELVRHRRGLDTAGTYVNDGDQARTLVFDLDQEETAQADAVVVRDALVRLGVPLPCIGIEFSGKKGYHVWVVLGRYTYARDLRRVGRAILAETGLSCEVFPKQDEARDLGSLVKLPGGVHQVTGKHNDFVTAFPKTLPLAKLDKILEGLPQVSASFGGTRPEPFHCMSAIQEGVKEGGRNNAIFHLAVMSRRAGLNDENTEMVVRNANAEASPPLDEEEIVGLLESSKHAGPVCGQLGPELHCGEACILNRVQGLHVRPGRLKFATPGEAVVVQVKDRTDEYIELEHPDISWGKGVSK